MHVLPTLAIAIQALALAAEAKQRKTCHSKSSQLSSSKQAAATSSSIAVGGASSSAIVVGTNSVASPAATIATSSLAANATTTRVLLPVKTSLSSASPAASSAVVDQNPGGGLKNLAFKKPSLSGALSGIRYSKVGANGGTYNQVVGMAKGEGLSCPAPEAQKCVKKQVSVSGALAPFNDQMTFVFRSMNVHKIAVYQPDGGNPSANTWEKVSSFTAGSPASNLVWMNNMGGSESGVWDACHGASQSFADKSLTKAATSPTAGIFNGVIPAGFEANIMTSSQCGSGGCPGFVRGAGMQGWGGSKMLVVEFDMPSTPNDKPPAIWALNAQVVHAAQYGCNCRGMGGDGGCGELDIFEVLPSAPAGQAFSEIYSTKGATGSGADFFPRPTGGKVTFATLFDVQTDSISILGLDKFDFDAGSFARSTVDAFIKTPAKEVNFGSGSKKRHHAHSSYMSHDLRRRRADF